MHYFTFSALFLVFVLAGELVLAGVPHNDPVWNKRRHARISAPDDAVDAMPADGHGSDNLGGPHNETGIELRELQSFEKRFSGGEYTFFAVGLGACGGYNNDNEAVVALNAVQWAGGAHCGEQITISYGDKTAQARIVDLCPICGFGSLDLSPSLFRVFAPESAGRLFGGSWVFGGAPPPPPPQTSQSRPATSTQTSSTTARTTATSASVPTSSATSTSTTATTTTSSPAAGPTSDQVESGNVQHLMVAFGQLGGVAMGVLSE